MKAYTQIELQKLMDENAHLDWFHRFEVVPGSGIYTPGNNDVGAWEGRMNFLQDDGSMFKDKRVLDIGAYSGAFSFFLEEHGAEVTALDVYDPDLCGFNLVKEIRNSSVRHVQISVYDICPEALGYFDIVAFYGVYYHLKHPLLAFERIHSVLRDGGLLIGGGTGAERWFHNSDPSCVEGVDFSTINSKNLQRDADLRVDSLNELPLIGYVKKQVFRDVTSWFLPNEECVKAWVENSGFSVEKSHTFTASIKRDWNLNDIKRSSTTFLAIKSKSIRPEYVTPCMKPFQIPTGWELEKLKEENKRLKEILFKNRNKMSS